MAHAHRTTGSRCFKWYSRTLVCHETALLSKLTNLSKSFSYPQLLEGPRHVVNLYLRHHDPLTTVYIMEMANSASLNVIFCLLNKNAWPGNINKLFIQQAVTRRGPSIRRERKGNWTRAGKKNNKEKQSGGKESRLKWSLTSGRRLGAGRHVSKLSQMYFHVLGTTPSPNNHLDSRFLTS